MQNSQCDIIDVFGETKNRADQEHGFGEVQNNAGVSFDSETLDYNTPVILDCGSLKTRAGFAGCEKPSFTIPTVVATCVTDYDTKKLFGTAALESSNCYKLSYPVEQGLITNWHDGEDLFEYVIDHYLRIQPPMHQVVVIQPLNNSFLNQEKIAEIMFEKFKFNSFQLVPSAPMGMLGSNGKTGIVVESGAGQTQIVAVENCDYIRSSLRQIPLGGNDLSRYMGQLLAQTGNVMSCKGKRNELELLNEIKELGCYVAENYEEELQKMHTNSRFLRNSSILRSSTAVDLMTEAYQVPELLFKPEMINIHTGGIPQNIYESIESCSPDLKAELYGNIGLCGGNTMFDGIVNRLLKEVKSLAGPNVSVKINAPPNRDQTVFIGTSLLGICSKFQDNLISSQEYNDFGPRMLQWKYI